MDSKLGVGCQGTGTAVSTIAYNFKNCQGGQAAAVYGPEVRKMEIL
jgi:hypothetical protein